MIITSKGQTNFTVCPSKLIYHIPCPGCGLTRATVQFLHGNIKEAILLNPNVFFAIAFLFITPAIYVYDNLWKKEALYGLFVYINRLLNKPIILTLLLVFELVVWVRNVVNGI